jgi:hypothetical protein
MHHSENHELIFRTTRYLMGRAYADDVFKAWRRRGRTLAAADARWLERFLRYRARRGWGEFDSACYFLPSWECLLSLHDYAQGPRLAGLARKSCDLMLADMAAESLAGMYCGAHGRIYGREALDHAGGNTYALQYLYFGNVDPRAVEGKSTAVDVVVSRYRPKKIIVDLALDRREPYECLERKHLHNTADVLPRRPLRGSISKYTYWTPFYAMGCVQRQDKYPARCPGAWYAHHEQHEWDFTIGTRTRSRIFTHHPGTDGNEHGYWTGDIRCGCGHFFQHRTALVALYDVAKKQAYQMIHAYVPRDAFDEVTEEGGFIFVREGQVAAALKLMGGHKWTRRGEWKNVEVTSPGGRNGAVCEVGLVRDFGGFAGFRREVLSNRVEFDPKRLRLAYDSRRAGSLYIDAKGGRRLDGDEVDLDYPLYRNPYVRSEYGSGVVEIKKGRRRLRLDFREKGRL